MDDMGRKRDLYLDKLIKREKNGLVKVVTGIRRCGKSYLLFYLYDGSTSQAWKDYYTYGGLPPILSRDDDE